MLLADRIKMESVYITLLTALVFFLLIISTIIMKIRQKVKNCREQKANESTTDVSSVPRPESNLGEQQTINFPSNNWSNQNTNSNAPLAEAQQAANSVGYYQQNSHRAYPFQPHSHHPQQSSYNEAYLSSHVPSSMVGQSARAPPADHFRPSMSNRLAPPSYSETMGLKQAQNVAPEENIVIVAIVATV